MPPPPPLDYAPQRYGPPFQNYSNHYMGQMYDPYDDYSSYPAPPPRHNYGRGYQEYESDHPETPRDRDRGTITELTFDELMNSESSSSSFTSRPNRKNDVHEDVSIHKETVVEEETIPDCFTQLEDSD